MRPRHVDPIPRDSSRRNHERLLRSLIETERLVEPVNLRPSHTRHQHDLVATPRPTSVQKGSENHCADSPRPRPNVLSANYLSLRRERSGASRPDPGQTTCADPGRRGPASTESAGPHCRHQPAAVSPGSRQAAAVPSVDVRLSLGRSLSRGGPVCHQPSPAAREGSSAGRPAQVSRRSQLASGPPSSCSRGLAAVRSPAVRWRQTSSLVVQARQAKSLKPKA